MYDESNRVVQLCVEGMQHEGFARNDHAKSCFERAWSEAQNDFKKSTAAHYLARHQPDASQKLKWDLIALQHAIQSDKTDVKNTFASLYLNVAKGYEDLNDHREALMYYQPALTHAGHLTPDPYAQMITQGIKNGLQRMKNHFLS